MAALPPIQEGLGAWRTALVQLEALEERLWSLHMVAYGHNSAHTDDVAGREVLGRSTEVLGRTQHVWTRVESEIGTLDEAGIRGLATGELTHSQPFLEHIRSGQRLKLKPELQALLTEADREALHGWGELYSELSAKLSAPFERDGEVRETSVGQLNALQAHPDADVRKRAFTAKNLAYNPIRDTCATILTHLTGTRQMRFDRVGADELATTLLDNRIDADVLNAMWEGVATRKASLGRYLDLKARALGSEKLDWWDLSAPLGTAPGGSVLSWSDAQTLVVDAFSKFEPDLADFAMRLLREGGIEAADRPHKRSGGYCMPAPQKKTSRIFMTYTGSVDNAITLAHELGHAWHSDILFQEPRDKRHITSGLAESASTFAESIVRDQLLSSTEDPEVQLFMLDQELQAGVAFLMNIDARYGFERALYRLRREGPLTADALTEVMLAEFERAYDGHLGSVDPNLWVNKLHFYISEFGFYNWPYTFGYLFSSAIYRRALEEGPAFRAVLRELLIRTGWQDCRPLAQEVLGVDLADPTFWAGAARPLEHSLERFEAILETRFT